MAFVNNDPTPKQSKILLVDDREDNLLSIEAILAPDGYQFFRAYSGHQALKILLNEFDFAMILMDVKMPVLNGFETASLIYEREKLKHIPIIFITANNYGDENVFKGYQAGGIDYILKPINPDVLRVKVSVFANLYRKNRLLLEQEQKLVKINEILGNEITDRRASEEKVKAMNNKLLEKIAELEHTNNKLKHLTFDSLKELKGHIHETLLSCDQLLGKHKDLENIQSINNIKSSIEKAQECIHGILSYSEETIPQ